MLSNDKVTGWYDGVNDNSTVQRITSITDLSQNRYHFIVYQFNGNDSISIYVDGQFDSSQPVSIPEIRNSDLDLYLGAWREPVDGNSINNLSNGVSVLFKIKYATKVIVFDV